MPVRQPVLETVTNTHISQVGWGVVVVLRIILHHSCQPLVGVNLSPEFVNLYFLYAGWGPVFWLIPAAFLIPISTCGSGRKKQCYAKYACTTSNLISDEIFQHFALGQPVCIWQWRSSAARLTVFQSFCCLKHFMNFFPYIHFPVSWPYPPKLMNF